MNSFPSCAKDSRGWPVAARENQFQAFKVGTLIFYHADQVAQFVSDLDRTVNVHSGLIALPSPSRHQELS